MAGHEVLYFRRDEWENLLDRFAVPNTPDIEINQVGHEGVSGSAVRKVSFRCEMPQRRIS